MKIIFSKGDVKTYRLIVNESDVARFDSGQVHPVYATFALARDIEWACRQFVLEMKEPHEEGIGTMLTIEHVSPALVDTEVTITATAEEIADNGIVCSYEVHAGNRLIARGRQGQKVLPKTKITEIFERAKKQ